MREALPSMNQDSLKHTANDTVSKCDINGQERSARYESYRGGSICVRCGHQGEPLEPLFDMKLAAELVPMRYASLMVHLSRNRDKYPARYRADAGSHRKIRLLSASEIKRIRAQVLRGRGV
jgi:hypothetical protein